MPIKSITEPLFELKLKISPPYRFFCYCISFSEVLVLDFLKKDYNGALKKKDLKRAIERYKNL